MSWYMEWGALRKVPRMNRRMAPPSTAYREAHTACLRNKRTECPRVTHVRVQRPNVVLNDKYNFPHCF